MSFLLVLLSVVPLAAATLLRPSSVSLADLEDVLRFQAGGNVGRAVASEVFERALSDVGLMVVSNIPGLHELRADVLLGAQSCSTASPKAQTVTLSDGTMRRTLATVTRAGVAEEIDHGVMAGDVRCKALNSRSRAFRELVGRTATAFAQRLGDVFPTTAGEPVMRTSAGGSYATLEAAVLQGDQLEHFHSYSPPPAPAGGDEKATVELHTDQGLFIAFTPPMMSEAGRPSGGAAGRFELILADGTRAELDLSGVDGSSLVFMLGDGSERLLNPRLAAGKRLHAAPHALTMPRSRGGGLHQEARLWYGRMFLPPSDALSELQGLEGLSQGRLREMMVEASVSEEHGQRRLSSPEEDVLFLGCSHNLYARELQAATCTANQIYCWVRCMDYTEDANPTNCSAKSMGFNCTSQFDQISLGGLTHGDYNPACTTSTSLVTPRPSTPQPTGTCPGWAELIADSTFPHSVQLASDESVLLWRVDGGNVTVKMVHKGRAGWLAVGVAGENTTTGIVGMSGASVVMGTEDEDTGRSTGEYRIDPLLTAWRHWKTPLANSSLGGANFEVTDCFSMLTFTAESIYGRPLNVTGGTNNLVWALSHDGNVTQKYGGYAPFHTGATWRGHKSVNFKTGEATSTSTSPLPTTTAAGTTTGTTTKMLTTALAKRSCLWSIATLALSVVIVGGMTSLSQTQ